MVNEGHADRVPNASVRIGAVTVANDAPLAVFAGPCQMESRDHALEMAAALKEIAGRLGFGLIFKTSFDKANRTSISSQRGMGLDKALPVFAEIRESLGLPVVTDVHSAEQCALVAEPWTCCKFPPSCAARPTCWWRRRKPGAS